MSIGTLKTCGEMTRMSGRSVLYSVFCTHTMFVLSRHLHADVGKNYVGGKLRGIQLPPHFDILEYRRKLVLNNSILDAFPL